MDKTQSRISTGLRVANASDNAAHWSIAATMQSVDISKTALFDKNGGGAAKGVIDKAA